MTMLTEPQKRWLAALRGGEFKQCRGQLSKDGGYCCLGVACEIFREELAVVKKELPWGGGFEYDGNNQYLPLDVQNYLDMKTWSGVFNGLEDKESLVGLNDNGMTFEEIADVIEANADQIFTKGDSE